MQKLNDPRIKDEEFLKELIEINNSCHAGPRIGYWAGPIRHPASLVIKNHSVFRLTPE
jgi:hypothetical protein